MLFTEKLLVILFQGLIWEPLESCSPRRTYSLCSLNFRTPSSALWFTKHLPYHTSEVSLRKGKSVTMKPKSKFLGQIDNTMMKTLFTSISIKLV